MKNIELKLLVEGVGGYTLRGEAEDNYSPVKWIEYGGELNMKDYMPNRVENVFKEQERLVVFADNLYPTRNISTILIFRKSIEQ